MNRTATLFFRLSLVIQFMIFASIETLMLNGFKNFSDFTDVSFVSVTSFCGLSCLLLIIGIKEKPSPVLVWYLWMPILLSIALIVILWIPLIVTTWQSHSAFFMSSLKEEAEYAVGALLILPPLGYLIVIPTSLFFLLFQRVKSFSKKQDTMIDKE
jgi:hypothetical protein